ncbi:phosphoribosylformylglycinamidine synthase subunit I [Sulfurimonas denitrificans DSM 1251]|uniref:Phosphoribosylformylglycinamidine synthase subunit PurQ n=1 Tax=Sulfurimonas denitrificans (strain ATCC 33889 / DSM 1251) TaxID=326298 RepID=PURQ_SULDN|nr:phosphoribosylformylglycinamidine synthase subunit PurQ [Sulfurimonas denitrificans]Q30TB2.1 RecName: Full=Phosphoribosylformylglycinamidine synthase subunit PurQ; Short=FGAM synthase; AltName: Full=Formylglycinamide ribonucleotide amidotransferase subunit I; Short=FGAR amidotransferase I; Short=FGAR-AT I; AltName: Full=Glutaminase PurQ; AltName: Full=Phosphoribosylformylglycinamidine synthase subunit I [Sulfurimonas denitrificans DSM 1251]ABB43769.1 phosphoribosylformylglycinamidine synthase 
MKVTILQFPGTNCEYDAQHAFKSLGAETEILWHKSDTIPSDTDLLIVAGGFSYGDYLRSGAIAKFSPVMKAVIKYADDGGKVLGICNGFQVLTESGLLPGALKRNESLHFLSKHHHLKVINNENIFLEKLDKGDIVNIPIAHHDGNYYIDDSGLKELYANNQVLLKYCDENGNDKNPNGSIDSIAGICNKERNVFGLMPHPERAMEAILGSDDGIKMLQGFLRA